MNLDTPRGELAVTPVQSLADAGRSGQVETLAELEHAVDFIVDECFFAMGQAIAMRMTVDYDAVVFMREHYRAKFLAAMKSFGNRWSQDRQNVTSVAWMFAERAVRYAGDRGSIDVESARKAAADVQRYCRLHARRAGKSNPASEGGQSRIAGYWCGDDEG